MKVRFNKWKPMSELPKKDGSYAVIGFDTNGVLCYMLQLDYTTKYGWNTTLRHFKCPIGFDEPRHLQYYWSSVSYNKEA